MHSLDRPVKMTNEDALFFLVHELVQQPLYRALVLLWRMRQLLFRRSSYEVVRRSDLSKLLSELVEGAPLGVEVVSTECQIDMQHERAVDRYGRVCPTAADD